MIRRGFAVEVLPYRALEAIVAGHSCAVPRQRKSGCDLLVEAGDSLIVDLNDSPLCGERRFIRDIVGQYDNKRTYMAALCSNDADMFNLVDAEGRRVIDHARAAQARHDLGFGADRGMPGCRFLRVVGVAAHLRATRRGLGQSYRVGWSDVVRHWTRPAIRLDRAIRQGQPRHRRLRAPNIRSKRPMSARSPI